MKVNKTLTALIASAGLGLSSHAFAAFTAPGTQTAAGTTIGNQVSLDYSVNGIDQDNIDSAVVNFIVDTRVDFAVELNESATVKATPKGTGYVSTFALANYSNEALDFSFAATNLANGSFSFLAGTETDNFDITTLAVYIEEGSNSGYQALEDTATSINDLATYANAGDEVTVYVVVESNIPSTGTDKDVAGVQLAATALQGDGSAIPDQMDDANLINTKQFVFADASNDGVETLNTAFEVSSAKFTHIDPDDGVTVVPGPGLVVVVVDDEFCNGTYTAGGGVATCDGTITDYKPKGIPGAMVEYTITATNTGSLTANSVVFVQNLSTLSDTLAVTADLVSGSLANVTAKVNSTDIAAGDISIVGDELTVTAGDVAINDTVTITFTAIVE